jgi:indoleamine 2,3-dioxygenase
MDYTNALPDASSLVRLLLKVMNPRRLTGDTRSRTMLPMDQYDIDSVTGFFPPQALPRLTGPYEAWESALDEATEKLSLGEDTRAQAKAKRADGDSWRVHIRSVSTPFGPQQ